MLLPTKSIAFIAHFSPHFSLTNNAHAQLYVCKKINLVQPKRTKGYKNTSQNRIFRKRNVIFASC
jgi:hypothetical protein